MYDLDYLLLLAELEAKRRGMYLCRDKTVIAILTCDENKYFGFNFTGNTPPAQCPRESEGFGRGFGYHLCVSVCNSIYHAEIDALKQYLKHERPNKPATMLVFNVNHICNTCKGVLGQYPHISYRLIK